MQECVPAYRYRFFQLLAEELERSRIDLTVLTSSAADDKGQRILEVANSWAHLVRCWRWPLVRHRTIVWQPIIATSMQANLVVLPHMTRFPSNLFVLAARRMLGRPVAFWGLGKNWQARGEAGRFVPADHLLQRLVRIPDWWFAYTDAVTDLLIERGFPQDRITTVQNSTDTRSLRARMRTQTATKGKYTCLFVGTLYPDKGLRFLLNAADVLSERLPDFRLIVVGGGEQLAWLRAQRQSRPWLEVMGPLSGTEKAEAAGPARLMLMPAHIGLVAVDSFAMETPIVTRDVGFQHPEVMYLQDGVNARILPGDTDIFEYADVVQRLLEDDEAYSALLAGCRIAAETYTVEAMAKRFAFGINQAIQAGRRGHSSRPRWIVKRRGLGSRAR